MKKSTFTILGLSLLIVVLTSGVKSTKQVNAPNGITGFTTSGCTCHSPSRTGTLTLSGIPTTSLKSTAYTFSLIYNPGVSKKYWGMDLAATAGTLAIGTATGVKVSGGEIVHSAKASSTATSYTYSGLKWTSPATAQTATFNFAMLGSTVSSGTGGVPVDQVGTFSTSVVLPVEFSSFGVVKLSNNKVAVNWKTATEINSSFFEVEKSIDAKNFISISKVAAAGNASDKSYSIVDALDNNNTATYYRIKSVDKNGEFGYSSTQSINSKSTTVINSVFPNPVKKGQNVNVELTSEKEQTISFVLINAQGKIVSSKQKTVIKGYNRFGLQFGNYIVAGNYYLQAKEDNNLLSPVTISVVE